LEKEARSGAVGHRANKKAPQSALACFPARRPTSAPCRPRDRPLDVTLPSTWIRAMLRLLYFIDFLLNLYIFILIAQAILSWLVVFNVVNTRSPVVAAIGEFLYRITEPVLRPIRQMLPNFGGIDISPLIVILIIYFLQIVVIGNLREVFI
jgi:YggT family protein